MERKKVHKAIRRKSENQNVNSKITNQNSKSIFGQALKIVGNIRGLNMTV